MAIRSEDDVMAILMRGGTPLAYFQDEEEAQVFADHLNAVGDRDGFWVADYLPSDPSQVFSFDGD